MGSRSVACYRTLVPITQLSRNGSFWNNSPSLLFFDLFDCRLCDKSRPTINVPNGTSPISMKALVSYLLIYLRDTPLMKEPPCLSDSTFHENERGSRFNTCFWGYLQNRHQANGDQFVQPNIARALRLRYKGSGKDSCKKPTLWNFPSSKRRLSSKRSFIGQRQ